MTFVHVNATARKKLALKKTCKVLLPKMKFCLTLLGLSIMSKKEFLKKELSSYMSELLARNTSGAVATVNLMHEFTSFHIRHF